MRRQETSIRPEEMAALVGGLTGQLRDLEEERAREGRRRSEIMFELMDTRQRSATLRASLDRLWLLAAVFVGSRLLVAGAQECGLLEMVAGVALLAQLVFGAALGKDGALDPLSYAAGPRISAASAAAGGGGAAAA
jgi:hypothetical protein